jgi:hypothetical protein
LFPGEYPVLANMSLNESVSEINLTSNIEARIRHPLAGIPHDRLLRDVEIFARENGLTEELPVLRKGAIREPSLINQGRCSHIHVRH